MLHAPSTGTAPPRFMPLRPATGLILATAGYGVMVWAWQLLSPLGPSPGHRFAGSDTVPLLAALTFLVGAAGRIPVGLLTDRFGARVTLPGLALFSGSAVLAVAATHTTPAPAVLAVMLGVPGTVFAAGSAAVIRAYPRSRRGPALSLFGAGIGVAPATALLARRLLPIGEGRPFALVTLALLGYAGIAAVLVRDRRSAGARRVRWQVIATGVLRLPTTWYLSAWYAVAFGGLAAVILYLPGYLRHVYRMDWNQAAACTAICVIVTAVTRPVGGRLCQRRDPVAVLRACFLFLAACCLVLACRPPLAAAATALLFGAAACLGVSGGVVHALIGATAPPAWGGAVAGAVGTVGGIAGMVPPFLLAVVYRASHSYGLGLALLAVVALAATVYLHVHRLWVDAALAFPATDVPWRTTTAVVTLPPARHGLDTAQVITALTTLAARRELVVVSSTAHHTANRRDEYALVTGLRFQLPSHQIMAVVVGAEPHPDEIALVKELVADGALPVLLTAAADAEPIARLMAVELDASQILRVTCDVEKGLVLQPARLTATPVPATQE